LFATYVAFVSSAGRITVNIIQFLWGSVRCESAQVIW
jgi:hypothetical protein